MDVRWGRELLGRSGGSCGIDDAFAQQLVPGIGTEIMGAGKFGPPGWHEDPEWSGWWGPDPPFHTPVFVLTHHPHPPIEMEAARRSTSSTRRLSRRWRRPTKQQTARTEASADAPYLLQLARYRGCRTVNVVRREDAVAIVREAGGDVVVIDDDDLAGRVAEATGGAAIRLGIDAVGGTATGRLADCLCDDAILVIYGRMSDASCTVHPDAFVFRNLTMRGFWLVNWFRRTPESEREVLLGEIAELIAKGKLHAPIHATYDVSEIKEAVAVAASGGRSGKVLIVPRPDSAHRHSPGPAFSRLILLPLSPVSPATELQHAKDAPAVCGLANSSVRGERFGEQRRHACK
jgi:hypothetical protein